MTDVDTAHCVSVSGLRVRVARGKRLARNNAGLRGLAILFALGGACAPCPISCCLASALHSFRGEVAEIRVQQAAMAKNIAALDERVTSLEERFTSLEETVDARLKETRPIWKAVQGQIEKLDQKFDIVIRDLYDVRGDLALHAKRISQLEHAISS